MFQIKVVVINNYSIIKMIYLVIQFVYVEFYDNCLYVYEGDLKMYFIFCKFLCIGDYINFLSKVVFFCIFLEMFVCISYQ